MKARLDAEKSRIDALVQDGKHVAIWGAGSKTVSYLTTLDLSEQIDAVVDINPHKHGAFLAGTGHEILPPRALADLRPDYVVIMNPIYENEIRGDLQSLGLNPVLIPL